MQKTSVCQLELLAYIVKKNFERSYWVVQRNLDNYGLKDFATLQLLYSCIKVLH